MIVSCESCKSRYKLDDSKVTGRGAKITCPKCKHVFVVLAPTASLADAPRPALLPVPGAGNEWEDDEPTRVGREEAEAAAAAEAARAEPAVPAGHQVVRPRTTTAAPAATREQVAARAATLDFRKVGVSAWKVNVRIGLVYDFSDIKTLRRYIQDGRVTPADVISHDGKSWKPIGEIPDLDVFFVESYERLAIEFAARPAPTKETQPSPTDLGNVAAALAAAAAADLDDGAAGRASGPTYADPFDAMKKRQRERGPTRKAAAKGSPLGGVRIAIVVAVVALLAVGGWWYASQPPPAPPVAAVVRPPTKGVKWDDKEPKPPAPRPNRDPEEVPVVKVDDGCVMFTKEGLCVTGFGGVAGAAPVAGRSPSGAGAVQDSKAPVAQVLTTSPTDNEAVGDAAMKSKDYDTAIQAFRKAIAEGKGSANVKLGQAQFLSGDEAGGAATLNTAAASQKRAYKVLGDLLEAAGDVAGAKVAFGQYLESGPSDATAIRTKLAAMGG